MKNYPGWKELTHALKISRLMNKHYMSVQRTFLREELSTELASIWPTSSVSSIMSIKVSLLGESSVTYVTNVFFLNIRAALALLMKDGLPI